MHQLCPYFFLRFLTYKLVTVHNIRSGSFSDCGGGVLENLEKPPPYGYANTVDVAVYVYFVNNVKIYKIILESNRK